MEDQLPKPSTVKLEGKKFDVSFFGTDDPVPPGVVCMIRGHSTGKPYIGIALLSPTEPSESISPAMACKIALYRAMDQYSMDFLRDIAADAPHHIKNETLDYIKAIVMLGNQHRRLMYSLVRYDAMPEDQKKQLADRLEEIARAVEEKIAKKTADKKRERWEKRHAAKMAAQQEQSQEN